MRLSRWYLRMANSVLLPFLAGYDGAEDLDHAGWSLLFAEARSVGLNHRIAGVIRRKGIVERLPDAFRHHVLASEVEMAAFQRDVAREIGAIGRALSSLEGPKILLKGAAYVYCSLSAAMGRSFSDIDLLVPKGALANAESQLMCHGWLPGKLSDYDQRYYRTWSHEIPPLTHLQRGTSIDLHHSLVMPTCRLPVDSQLMINDAIPLGGGWWRLNDLDLVLHSIAHLLLNSEFTHGLRDLSDIDLLYRDLSAKDAGFSRQLEARAQAVGLSNFLYLAALLCHSFFQTPVPDNWLDKSAGLIFPLFKASCSVRHPDSRPALQGVTDFTLMVREVFNRFPWRILIWHLAHKFMSATKTGEVAAN